MGQAGVIVKRSYGEGLSRTSPPRKVTQGGPRAGDDQAVLTAANTHLLRVFTAELLIARRCGQQGAAIEAMLSQKQTTAIRGQAAKHAGAVRTTPR